jgi:hypothetical protein
MLMLRADPPKMLKKMRGVELKDEDCGASYRKKMREATVW